MEKKKLIEFIQNNIFNTKTTGSLFNQYLQSNDEYDVTNASKIRQNNLISYLEQLNFPIQILFVGIAPGYKGCRFSGVPFTSEQVLLGYKQSNFFNANLYKQSSKGAPYTEISATKIWKSFVKVFPNEIKKKILLWNIVPFHPQGNDVLSNRDPNNDEIKKYKFMTEEFIKILKPKKICCFGNIPFNVLNDNKALPLFKIKHPSRASYNSLEEFYRRLLW